MPFNKDLIKVSKTSDKCVNLAYGPEGTITLPIKDCHSNFGLEHNKSFRSYSIGINIPDGLITKHRAVEERATTFLDEPPTKPLLRALVEKGQYKKPST